MFTRMSPNLMVRDVAETVKFYTDILGFEFVMSVPSSAQEILMSWEPERSHDYALVKSEAIEIMFQEAASLKDHVPAAVLVTPQASMTLYFYVDDVDAIHQRVRDKVEIVKDLHTTFYGMREFYIRDVNGYILGFAKPAV